MRNILIVIVGRVNRERCCTIVRAQITHAMIGIIRIGLAGVCERPVCGGIERRGTVLYIERRVPAVLWIVERETVRPEDLREKPLILSRQSGSSGQVLKWLKKSPEELNIVATYSLVYNAALMSAEGFGYTLALDKLINVSGVSDLCFRPLENSPELPVYLVWKKYSTDEKKENRKTSQFATICAIIMIGKAIIFSHRDAKEGGFSHAKEGGFSHKEENDAERGQRAFGKFPFWGRTGQGNTTLFSKPDGAVTRDYRAAPSELYHVSRPCVAGDKNPLGDILYQQYEKNKRGVQFRNRD